jgi:hypothetical protein
VRVTKPPPEVVPKDAEEPLFISVTNDVSKGKPKQLFGNSIVVENQVLVRLCPKGEYLEMQRKLAEATLDATSLDGMYSNMRLLGERTNYASKACLELKALIPHFTLP